MFRLRTFGRERQKKVTVLVGLGRILVGVGAVMTLLGGSLATASTLTPDLNPSHSASETKLRDGDFDGDGRIDALQLITEDDTGRVAVHVRLNTIAGPRDIRVTSLDVAANAPLNLQVVKAGSYRSDCGDYATSCEDDVTAAHDSLVFALDGGISILVHWQTDHFEQDFVRSDEATMTQALAKSLAGLLAANP